MKEQLRKLCQINGISGREHKVREEILSQISSYCDDLHVDPLGNIIAFKKGKKTPKQKLLISAHMDEVGLIVTGITSDGMLRFATVGGIDARVLVGRSVLVGNSIPGVIGTKAVHMQSAEEKAKATPVDQLYIDIGAKDKEDALQYVSLGESVCFQSEPVEFGNNCLKAKAIDDRFGCALMIQLLQSELPCDLYCSFVVQEEVGLRGAKVAAHDICPDIAIVLEATTAGDLAGVEELKQVCSLGKGPVIPFMDRATIYDYDLYQFAMETAKQHHIPCQTKTAVAGGNDAGAFSISCGGIKTVSVSVPCRYLHSPCCVINWEDAENSLALVQAMLERFANE